MSGNSDFHVTNETVLRERVRSDSRLFFFHFSFPILYCITRFAAFGISLMSFGHQDLLALTLTDTISNYLAPIYAKVKPIKCNFKYERKSYVQQRIRNSWSSSTTTSPGWRSRAHSGR